MATKTSGGPFIPIAGLYQHQSSLEGPLGMGNVSRWPHSHHVEELPGVLCKVKTNQSMNC